MAEIARKKIEKPAENIPDDDFLSGIDAIAAVLKVSPVTVISYKNRGMPMKKNGIWGASKRKIIKWRDENLT